MAQLTPLLFILLLSTFSIASTIKPVYHHRSQAKAFIEAQCRATMYSRLCVQCLSMTANSTTMPSSEQLAQFALMVSLAKAQHAKAYVTKVAAETKSMKFKEYQVVKDCLDQINDGVDQLRQSIKEIQQISRDGEENFMWHTSNVQTWVSTALTDAMTCLDGFSSRAMGGKVRPVRATIKAKLLNVVQVTSNALALFNRFAARHKAMGAKVKP